MALTHLPLYVGTAEPPSIPGDRSEAISAGSDPSPEEVVVAYHERTKHHYHRYALSLTAWKRVHETTWSLRANPSSGNLHPTDGYALLPALGAIHDHPGR